MPAIAVAVIENGAAAIGPIPSAAPSSKPGAAGPIARSSAAPTRTPAMLCGNFPPQPPTPRSHAPNAN